MTLDEVGHWALGILATAATGVSATLFKAVYRHDTSITEIRTQMIEREERLDERHADVKEDLREIKESLRGLASSSGPRTR